MTTNWQDEIKKNYNKIIDNYCDFGLRRTHSHEPNYQIGDDAIISHDWDYEYDCPAETLLDGTSSIGIDTSFLEGADDLINRINNTLPKMSAYTGKHIILIGGNGHSWGDDPDESIICGAKVLAIID